MDDYQEMVKALAKDGNAIIEKLTPEKAHALHMAVGIAGEAGELLDAIKKHVFYGKPLDVENVVEEMGDIEFYSEGLRQALGLIRGEILAANMDKLDKRYAGFEYSDKAAIERADKGDD